MQGSIQNRGKHSWRLVIDIGRDEHGKRLRKFVTVRGTKKDSQRKLRDLITAYEQGLPIDTSKQSVREFFVDWLKSYGQVNLSPRTYECYLSIIERHINPCLGSIPLAQVKPEHVQKLQAEIVEKGLSDKTALNVHRLLSRAMNHAQKWGLIPRNPCVAVDGPRVRRKESTILSLTNVEKLLNSIADSPYRHIIYLAIQTGCRRGEIIGLRWADVDFKSKTISINRSATRAKEKGIIIKEPKTAASRRKVSLSGNTVTMLAGLRAKQRENWINSGFQWNESAYLFGTPDGPMSPDTLSHAFHKIVKKTGLPQTRFHDLRHLNASVLLKEGVHPRIVQARLGHSSIGVTMDIYSHIMPELEAQAADVIDRTITTDKVNGIEKLAT